MKRTNFWALLGKYSITIPQIQRDYAQGRDTPKINNLRSNFIRDITKALDESHTPLDLGLFFGSSDKQNLILIDGQQRATTLWLVHWYVSANTQNHNANLERLSKFCYETRSSARDFCRRLASPNSLPEMGTELDTQIQDQPWFRGTWHQDRTVAGMLQMLKELHSQIQKIADFEQAWANLALSNDSTIQFRFVDIEQHNLSDDLYVKMNARGRPLTEFEKFKAWLEESLDSEELEGAFPNWKRDLDTVWLDTQWKELDQSLLGSNSDKGKLLGEAENESDHISTLVFSLFKNVALNQLLISDEKSIKEASPFEAIVNEQFLSTDMLKTLFPPKRIKSVFDVLEGFKKLPPSMWLDAISDITASVEDTPKTSLHPLEQHLFKPTFAQRIQFHALCLHLFQKPDELPQEVLGQSMRLVRNLTANSTIGADNYSNALKSIDKLLSGIQEVEALHERLKQLEELKGFDSQQVKEEQFKSEKILQNPELADLFLDVENHRPFRGRIGFLCQIGFTESEPSKDEIKTFEDSAKKCIQWLSPSYLEKPFELQRALLSKGDYTYIFSSNYSFGDSMNAWRSHLLGYNTDNDKNSSESKFQAALKKLIDSEDSPETCLNNFNDETFLNDFGLSEGWRIPLIQYVSTWEGMPRRCIHWIDKEEQSDKQPQVMLLKDTSLKSSQKELYSYVLHEEFLKNSKDLRTTHNLQTHYHWWGETGREANPRTIIELKSPNDENASVWKLAVTWNRSGKFEITPENATEDNKRVEAAFTKHTERENPKCIPFAAPTTKSFEKVLNEIEKIVLAMSQIS